MIIFYAFPSPTHQNVKKYIHILVFNNRDVITLC